jgi:hypothetical protein
MAASSRAGEFLGSAAMPGTAIDTSARSATASAAPRCRDLAVDFMALSLSLEFRVRLELLRVALQRSTRLPTW